MNGLNPQMMQRVQQLIQQNPQLAMLMQKPGLMQKLQAIASNPNDPTIAQQYASDPDVQQLISILGPAMGMGGMGGGGMGGMGGMNGMSGFNGMNNMSSSSSSSSSLSASNENVIYISSDSQFYDILLKTSSDKLIVCDFFATWCGPCKVIAPEFERFAKLYRNRAIFLKIDVDRNRLLAKKNKIAAMPTFHFYRGNNKIDELRGASIRKLEDLITKHISPNVNNSNQKQSNKAIPYKNFPLHEKNRPVYTKAPFKKMRDKLAQLNNKFIEDEVHSDDSKYSLDDSEWSLLKQIVSILQDRNRYHDTKFSSDHYKLLDKLLSWPSETLPPVLDLIRVLSLHPAFAEYCSKNFNFVEKVIKIGGNGLINAVNGMLTCRIIINLFNRRIISNVLESNFTFIINNLIFNMMCDERKNTRLAFVRVILHYTYCFYVTSFNISNKSDLYRAQKLRCFSLLTEILFRENEKNQLLLKNKIKKQNNQQQQPSNIKKKNDKDLNDIILNILMGIGTLIFRDENVIQFANSIDIQMIFKSYKQKYSKSKDIVDCCNELIQAIQNPQL